MKKLLLPYAYDNAGNLVHIDNAQKENEYTCPVCRTKLALRISKIPKGEKFHRSNHFAHLGSSDNHCSESFLHKLFKNKVTEYINEKITNGEQLPFEWDCEKCEEHHSGNLLKKAVKVVEEYNLDSYRPDIALLDKNNKVIIVIEIVVTHEPEPKTIKYYDDNKIACLQIKVESFDDCKLIDYSLAHPTKINMCPNPICKKCGHVMNTKKLVLVNGTCWKCNREMKIAMIEHDECYGLDLLTEKDVESANKNGANIKKVYSRTTKESYYANVCSHCNGFIGSHYLHEYFYEPHCGTWDLGYACYHCLLNERQR